MIAADARHTHKQMAVPAASQWAQDSVVRVRRVDFAAAAANRPSVHLQAPQSPRARRCRGAAPRATFRRGHSNRGGGAPVRRSAGCRRRTRETRRKARPTCCWREPSPPRIPKHGVAIISDGGAPSKVYSVGERVGGASLHSVYLDHVILDRAGALETLLLPRQAAALQACAGRGPAYAGRRPAHRGRGRQHSANGAAGPQYSRSGDAHRGLI